VSIPQKGKDPIVVSEDEEYKKVDFNKIPSLRAVFVKDGTCNRSQCKHIERWCRCSGVDE
jgi:hypothetical protein